MAHLILSLICHAATRAVRDAAFPADEALDAAGLARAASRAATIRRVDAALTSPALCARQTAAALQLDAAIEPELRELDYGTWTGRTLNEVASADPTGTASWLSDTSTAPHGGEPIDALLARVGRWLEATAQREGRMVAVTHASVLRAAAVIALNAKPAAFWRIDVRPLSRLRLRAGAGQWTLLSLAP